MAITSSINIDGVANTIVCTVLLNGITTLDTITYTNSNQQLSFPTLPSATLSINDFLQKLQVFNTFNNAIIGSIFSPQIQWVPFSSIDCTETNDGISQYEWVFQPGNHSIYDFTCTYPNGNVVIAKRNQAATLSYAQWIYFIYLMQRYQQIVRKNYGL